jgi:hypothetical protein
MKATDGPHVSRASRATIAATPLGRHTADYAAKAPASSGCMARPVGDPE